MVVFVLQTDCVDNRAQYFVAGNLQELGLWKPDSAIPLTLDGAFWKLDIALPDGVEVKYRYFQGWRQETTGKTLVIQWETNNLPRTFVQGAGPDQFGTYYNLTSTDHGWLTWQSEIRLRLFGKFLRLLRKNNGMPSLRLKFSAQNIEDDEAHEVVDNWISDVQYSVLNEFESMPKPIPADGFAITPEDYVVLRLQTLVPSVVSYEIELHDSTHGLIGIAHILPEQLQDKHGKLFLPLVAANGKSNGQLTVDFLVISPPALTDLFDLRVSFTTFWQRDRQLDIGHRGMGSSYKIHPSKVRENTVASMNQAAQYGADMVEFDVVLSKDLVPIIYHDFNVCVKRFLKDGQVECGSMGIHELTLEQLRTHKLDHASQMGKCVSRELQSLLEDLEETDDNRPFPTLAEFFERISANLAFNVEIKYCMRREEDGQLEDGIISYMERNRYVDIILDKVFSCAGDRTIVFSCFDPDTCTMLRLKQNKHPVLFLTQAESTKHKRYLDPRTHSVKAACHFACSESLLGIDPDSEVFISNPTLISYALERNLVIFCWGSDNNSGQIIRKLKKLGVHAVIYDRIYELKSEQEKDEFENLIQQQQQLVL